MFSADEGWTGPGELEILAIAVLFILLVSLLYLWQRRGKLMDQIMSSLNDLRAGRSATRLPRGRATGREGELVRAFNEVARSVQESRTAEAPSPDGFVVQGAQPSTHDTDMVTRLCQELRVPLGAIQGLAENLLDEQDDALRPKQRERTMRLLANVKSLTDLLQEADDLSEIRRGLVTARRADQQQASHRVPTDSVVIIEDDEIFARDLSTYLEGVGFQVVTAQTGEAGIALCQAQRPAGVIIDALMPGQDAWYVLGELKGGDRTKQAPVVLVSNLAQKRSGVVIGADDYLVKPVSKSTLMETLSVWGQYSQMNSALVVAENDSIRSSLREFLSADGARVTTMSSGAELLAHLAVPDEVARQTMPKVVLLDLFVSDTDGFEILWQLRAHTLWRRVPVVVLTSKHLSTEEQQFLVQAATRVVGEHGKSHQEAMEEVLEWLYRLGASPSAAPAAS